MEKHRKIFLIANIVGLGLYVFFVFRIKWFISLEKREYPDFGDNLNYLMTAAPTLLLFILILVVFFIFTILKKDMKGVRIAGIICALWLSVFFLLRLL